MHETIIVVDIGHSVSIPEKSQPLQNLLFPYQAFTLAGVDKAINWIKAQNAPAPDAMLIDVHTPGEKEAVANGVHRLKSVTPDLPVLLLVSYGDDDVARTAIQAGAFDCLIKPVVPERLRVCLHNALKIRHMGRYIAWLEQRMHGQPEAGPILLDGQRKVKTLRSLQKEAIRLALEEAEGCMTQAARALGIGRSTLYRKVSEFAIGDHISRDTQTTRPMMKVSSSGCS